MALEAGNMVMQGNSFANAKSANIGTHCNDNASRFVPKYARRWHCAVMDFLDISRADTARGDFDQKLAGLDSRDGDSFKAKVVRTAINDGLHGLRNLGSLHNLNLNLLRDSFVGRAKLLLCP
jgi:hypothetical protein